MSRAVDAWRKARDAAATPSVFISHLPGQHGYATVHFNGDTFVHLFPDLESCRAAMTAERLTTGDRRDWPSTVEQVLIFEPDTPPNLSGEVEDDDDEASR